MRFQEQTIVLKKGLWDAMRILKFLTALPKDIDLKLVVSEAKKERSNLQNRALWGCAYKAICEATGNDPETIHELMCGEYFGWKRVMVLGRPHQEPKRWTTHDENGKRDVINTLHLSDFYGFIQQYAAEKAGIFVPDPDPDWFAHQEKVA